MFHEKGNAFSPRPGTADALLLHGSNTNVPFYKAHNIYLLLQLILIVKYIVSIG